MLGFPNRADGAVLSGGMWSAKLPLANLLERSMDNFARTTNTAPSSSVIVIDLGKGTNIRDVSLRNHNLSLAARYRVTASTLPDFSVLTYDSGWSDVWPVVYAWGTLEWEDDNFWSGKYTAEETQGYTAQLDHILPLAKALRYWKIELSDPKNPAGYIQAGRLFIGPVWQPKMNLSYGASLAWETGTIVKPAASGKEYFNPQTPYRVARFSLDFLTQDEAFSRAFELQRKAGIDKEILYIHNPDDTVHALRRRFLGRLRTLGPIEDPYYKINKTSFEVKELL